MRILSDGHFHSGEDLARLFSVSRATIFQVLADSEKLGLQIFRVRKRGYKLVSSLDLLDAKIIQDHVGENCPFNIEIIDHINSTNSLLLEQTQDPDAHGKCIAAELQTKGRGRQGRVWYSGIAGALTFSVLWRFKNGIAALSGLSLAVGIAVAKAFEELGISEIKLKWPNDVHHNGRKLAGILIEVQGEMLGPGNAVIGIGLNYRLTPEVLKDIDQAAIDVVSISDSPPSRNLVLATILRILGDTLIKFENEGFQPFVAEWEQRHVHQNKKIRLLLPDNTYIYGIAEGVMPDGSLKVSTPTGIMKFNVGEISLRADV